MIVVHHLNNSRSQRIVWLMEEPLGKAPVIQDGDLVLAESGAIVEYLYLSRVGEPADALRARVEGMLGDELDLVEAELGRSAHLAGVEFSAASAAPFPKAGR